MSVDPVLDIDKSKTDPKQLGYDDLRRKGIAMVQALAGERWTDFNAHDPGVTILEQLCYALTESIYKSTFPIADYLTGPDGRIDYQKQAIYLPEQIFPCRPVTLDDLRKTIFDAVPEVDDVHLAPNTQNGLPGLYTIRVRLATGASENRDKLDQRQLLDRIRQIYCDNRNLCEDVDAVEIVHPKDCRLEGTIEVDGHRDPAEMLAQIYYRCSQLIAPGIKVTAYETALKKGLSLDTLLTGPMIRCGHIASEVLSSPSRPVTVPDIHTAIRSVEGVTSIYNLRLLDETNTPMTALPPRHSGEFFDLVIPDHRKQIQLTLVKRTKIYPVSITSLIKQYHRLEFNNRGYKNLQQDISALFHLPPAEHRPLEAYTSVQHHFPRVYGINRGGVPTSDGPRRMAQARQLKGYLLLFDQIMADFNSQLANIRRLFSTDKHLQSTYFHKTLDESSVPGCNALQAVASDARESKLAFLIKRYDDACDRRSRLLDVMLAMYGEQFTQKYLRHFHHYIPSSKMPKTVLNNKIRLLKHLPSVSRNRSGGLNYRHMAWENNGTAGFERKVRILLGLPNLKNRPLTAALAAHGLKLVSDTRFRQMIEGGLELAHVDMTDIKVAPTDGFHEVPPEASKAHITPDRIERLNQSVMLLQRQVINATFFRQGVSSHQYKIGPLTFHDDVQVIFKPFDDEQWCYLATYADRLEAVQAANDFSRLLLHLNIHSEGLHVVEHILLRPLSAAGHMDVEIPDNFFSFRISVLLPSWTARFHDPAFRRHAEDTIRINCPAHVVGNIYWLDYNQMHTFEMIYRKWLKAKSDCTGDLAGLDALSAQLIRLLSVYQQADDPSPKDDG